MSANLIALAGRRAALALMVDACTIIRRTGAVTNPETAQVTYTTIPVYSGKCRVSEKVKNARPQTVGEAQVWLIRLQLQLPMSAVGVGVNDLVTVTASVLDPDLVGRTFVVRELAHATHITARRVQVEEVTG